MKKRSFLLLGAGLIFTLSSTGQGVNKSQFREFAPGYYQNSILRDIRDISRIQNPEKAEKHFAADLSGLDLPNKLSLFPTRLWHQIPISQGNTGTCWCFSTISFYETEVYRLSNKKVKLSEMYTVYCEYIEKARRYVRERGKSNFSEGSEANAVARMFKLYGAMPEDAYKGLTGGRVHHNHEEMVAEMTAYLQNLKNSQAWNEEEALKTIKAIMDHYLGTPPAQFVYEGKNYDPKSFFAEVVRINPDDYVEFISLKEIPYFSKGEYPVPDNWWHSADYFNIPLPDFMNLVKTAIRSGFSMSIGGDVSEPGFDRDSQCALVPDFDIPADRITDDARQFRFSNQTTTDDHGMHLVGVTTRGGKDWFLIKDSSSGSRNNSEKAPEFGYYFFSEDYIKLKMMNITVHKDAARDILGRFK